MVHHYSPLGLFFPEFFSLNSASHHQVIYSVAAELDLTRLHRCCQLPSFSNSELSQVDWLLKGQRQFCTRCVAGLSSCWNSPFELNLGTHTFYLLYTLRRNSGSLKLWLLRGPCPHCQLLFQIRILPLFSLWRDCAMKERGSADHSCRLYGIYHKGHTVR